MTEKHGNTSSIPDRLSLKGRNALVVGAASGIGRATARCFAELGADVVLADRSPMDAVREEVEAAGSTATILQGDLTDDAFLQRIIAGGPYHSFAYVAGVFRGPAGSTPKESFDFVMNVNVYAPLVLGGGLIDRAEPGQGGYMVFVGSSAGRTGQGKIGHPDEYATYAASKGAVHILARSLASRGAAKNIVVNAVAPGVVITPMMDDTAPHLRNNPAVSPLGRGADPSELGWPIALLCTPAASFASGTVLDVNGGAVMA